jgi:hypothetical protein
VIRADRLCTQPPAPQPALPLPGAALPDFRRQGSCPHRHSPRHLRGIVTPVGPPSSSTLQTPCPPQGVFH